MVKKTLEQYLSDQDFDLSTKPDPAQPLNSSERAFVEKYLGLDMLPQLPEVHPEPVLSLPTLLKPLPVPKIIEVAQELPAKQIVVAPAPVATKEIVVVKQEALEVVQTTAEIPVQVAEKVSVKAEEKSTVKVETPVHAKEEIPVQVEEIAPAKTLEKTTVKTNVETSVQEKTALKTVTAEKPAVDVKVVTETRIAEEVKTPAHVTMRDYLRQQSEIQMLSFFVGGEMFLLPVAGIQEVLRYMETTRVPQAPSYIAGVINLRGKTTPLVHLSALVTNAKTYRFNKNNFIIIYSVEDFQLGLIIDKVSVMHMVPQNKIIWNIESKLGDVGDYIWAIANINDKVCAIVAPEMITSKLLGP